LEHHTLVAIREAIFGWDLFLIQMDLVLPVKDKDVCVSFPHTRTKMDRSDISWVGMAMGMGSSNAMDLLLDNNVAESESSTSQHGKIRCFCA